ncbi:MAG: DUF5686 family protein [Prevotellaceae bacterium]|nr:DUF5686 family protein [Prevotellaceae bacterium]MDY2749819.1 DUF5686 family protein [Prevotella sp.]
MKRNYTVIKIGRYFILFVFCLLAIAAKGQIRGVVIDAETGDSIPFASVSYKGNRVSAVSDAYGVYKISRHEGWTITFSAVGYRSKSLKVSAATPAVLRVTLKPEAKYLDEVMVKSKRSKYSRKDNPAVELMKRVIAAKRQTKLENKDYYQYRNYEKITISLNDISKSSLDSGVFARKPWLKKQVEKNPMTGKNVLPVIVTEKVFRKFYRKDPAKERIYIDAEQSYGVNELIETGDIFSTMAQEVFSEVDIYDDQVRLLQFPFTSPIGKHAIGFYRFYIVDTLKVDADSCIHVSFLPNNQQDFGFRGDLYILKDSTLHVKKVHLSIPSRSDVNFVKNMSIDQEYLRLPSGDWVLSVNDMLVELTVVGKSGNFLVSRVSRRNDYDFGPIDPKMFRGKAKEKRDPYSEMRSKDYWTDNREIGLTTGEEGMDDFLKGIKSIKGFGWLITGMKAVMENFVETSKAGSPSKVDIGPINSTVSSNDIDGFRMRMAAQTTANLNPHLFVKGYASHGFKTKNSYYGGTVTYSFNKKAYTPDEYPKRNIIVSSSYDICSPSDKFMNVDKDNVFASLRWSKVEKMAFYHRQTIDFEREEDWGFGIFGGLKFESNRAVGDWKFERLDAPLAPGDQGKFRISEAYLQLVYSPGQSYVNSKQRRYPTNLDSPVFKLKHTIGMKGFMGGQYDYHVTEASIYKRIWLNSWGKIDCYFKGGMQWSQVPFPMLIAPAANLSYIWQPETFELINNMEFLNDKYVSLTMEWNANGKLFNRIPLIKALQWRELIGFNILYGGLSDRNNPAVAANAGSGRLMTFPDGCYVMDPKNPYMEFRLGVQNIFKLLSVEYVRRLTYLNLPTATKHSVRFGFKLTF